MTHVYGCTGKVKYASRETALSFSARRRRSQAKKVPPLNAYPCDNCGCWHLSHVTQAENAARVAEIMARREKVAERTRARDASRRRET